MFATERKQGLESWDIHENDLARFRAKTHIRVLTPGSESGEPLHVLSSLERRSTKWDIRRIRRPSAPSSRS
jgi:hypothetical protein